MVKERLGFEDEEEYTPTDWGIPRTAEEKNIESMVSVKDTEVMKDRESIYERSKERLKDEGEYSDYNYDYDPYDDYIAEMEDALEQY